MFSFTSRNIFTCLFVFIGQNRPIPLLKLVHLRNMSYFNNSLLRNKRNDITAIDLQVTGSCLELISLSLMNVHNQYVYLCSCRYFRRINIVRKLVQMN